MKILKSTIFLVSIFFVSSFSFAEYTSLKEAVNDNTTNIKEYLLIKDEKVTSNLGSLGGVQLTIFGDNIYAVDGNSKEGINVGKYKILNIDCLTLENFSKSLGSVVYNSTGTINISSSTFNLNEAQNYGGVIYSSSGTINISSSIFSLNEASYGGGVVYISTGTTNISSTSFNSNKSNGYGGAVYNSSGTVNINSTIFSSNSGGRGGAIYNGMNGKLTITSTIFSSNQVSITENSYGGAIYNSNGTVNISSAIFSSNSATAKSNNSHGGAIHNSGSASKLIITSTLFSSNSVTATSNSRGGAIYNSGYLTITSTTFDSNQAKATKINSDNTGYGGAIYHESRTGTVNINSTIFSSNSGGCGGAICIERATLQVGTVTINSTMFNSNQARATTLDSDSYGGAIYSRNGIINISSTTFSSNNSTSAKGRARGGAISIINSGILTITSTTFNSNQVTTGDDLGGGGAIYNGGKLTITSTTFSSNQSNTTNGINSCYGGAIYNMGTLDISSTIFISNSVSAISYSYGGAIGNSGKLTITSTIFSSNTVKTIGGVGSYGYGGAIYNDGTLNLIAKNNNIEFIDNTVNNVSNAIHSEGGTINLWSSQDADIIFNDRITSEDRYSSSSVLNINSSTTTLTANGKIILNEDMSGFIGEVNLYGGEIELQSKITENSNINKNKFFSGKINLNNGTLNILNNAIDNITISTLTTTSNANLKFDVDLSNNTSDNFTVTNNVLGELNLTAINILKINEDEDSGQIRLFSNGKSPILNILTTGIYGGYEYTFTNNDISGILNYERTGLIIKTFKEYINATEPSIRSYSLSGNEIVAEDLGNFGGTQLTIFGNGYDVEGSNVEGIFISKDTILNVENVNKWNGFNSTYSAIKNEGILNISGTNFSNNATQDIINNGNLILSGISSSFEKGIAGIGTTTISSVDINLADSVIEQNKIEINNNGRLTTKAENVIGNIENNSNLIFTEGTNNNYIYGTGTTEIEGEVINSSTIVNNVIINGNKKLTTNATNIKGNIENNSNLIFSEGTNNNYVYGTGRTTIDGEVINSSTIVNSIKINENKKLTTNATNIKGNIENNANLIFAEGTNNNYVYGTGTTEINGEVINSSTIVNSVKINENKKLTTNAKNIIGNIENNSNLIFTEGTNNNYIYGTGTTEINGEVINSSTIVNSVKINENKKLITNVDSIAGNIENNGELVFSNNGENNNYIFGIGTTTISDVGINLADSVIEQNKIEINNNGRLTTKAENVIGNIENNSNLIFTEGINNNYVYGTGTTEIDGEVINSSTIVNSVKINENKNLTTNATNIYGQIENNGIYNVIGGTIAYNVGSLANGTINIKNDETTINKNVIINNNNINLGTKLKLLNEQGLYTSTLTINNGAILNTQNNKTGTVYIKSIEVDEGANWRYQLDVDLKLAKADNLINVKSVGNGSSALIDDIHLLSDKAEKTSVKIADNDIKATIESDNLKIYTTNLSYEVTTETDSNLNTFLNIEAIGYGGLANAIYDGINSYSVTENTDYLTKWIEDPIGVKNNKLKGNLNISGNNKIFKSTTGAEGLKTEEYTLQINNLNLAGFKETLTVNNTNGNLQLMNVSFSSNTGTAVITNSGTVELSGAIFDNTNIVNMDIINNNKLILLGSSTTFTKGISGKGTTTINGININLSNVEIKQDKIEIINNGNLTTNATNITGIIENNSNLIFVEGTNNNYVYGTGMTVVDGEVINSSTIVNSIIINSNKQLVTNATNVTGDIENDGILEYTNGTNINEIQGMGELLISGKITNNNIVNQSTITITNNLVNNSKLTTKNYLNMGTTINNSTITVNGEYYNLGTNTNNKYIEATKYTNKENSVTNNLGKMHVNILNIEENSIFNTDIKNLILLDKIENDGKFVLNNGTNDKYVYGSGTTEIDGEIINSSTIVNSVKINENKKLTTNVDSIIGNIENNGLLVINGGTNNNVITGTGLLQIYNNVVNQANITQNIEILSNKQLINSTATITINELLTINNDAKIINDGNLIISGGTNNGRIEETTNTSTTTITGTFINNGSMEQTIFKVEENGKVQNNNIIMATEIINNGNLKTSATNIIGNMKNNGTLLFNSGMVNNNQITGLGTLNITANNFINNNTIEQKNITISKDNDNDLNFVSSQLNIQQELNNFINNSTLSTENLNLKSVNFALTQNGNLFIENLSVQNSEIDLANSVLTEHNFKTISLVDDLYLFVDADLENKKMDTISANGFSGNGKINVKAINLLSDAKENKTEILFTSSTVLKNKIKNINTVSSKLFKYDINYDKNTGNFNFLLTAKTNPIIAESQVARAIGSITQNTVLNQAFSSIDNIRNRIIQAKQKGLLYASTADVIFESSNRIESGLWIRPFYSQDTISFDSLDVDNNLTGTLAGLDLAVGENSLLSFYLGYAGSNQKYDSIKVSQTGYIVGATGMYIKEKWYAGLTANINFNKAESQSDYGTDNFDMNMYSIGAKAGYNFDLSEKFILEPNLTLMYGNVGNQEYETTQGAKIDSQSTANIIVEPQVKVKLNLTNGWQPYGLLGYLVNAGEKTKLTADNIAFDDMGISGYIEYGLGVNKTFKNNAWSCYLQLIGKSGDISGFDGIFGIKYCFGNNKN